MKRIIVSILLIANLTACNDSTDDNTLSSLEDFIYSIEQNTFDCQEINWKNYDDSVKRHLKSTRSMDLTKEEKRKLNELKKRYAHLKKGAFQMPQINFYLDNSISMRGYIDGIGFRPAIAELLFADNDSDINLFYCNDRIEPIVGYNRESFLPALSKNSYTIFNATKSDINKTFESILTTISDSTIGILISDGIYSMGDASKAEEELQIKKTLTTVAFENKLNVQTSIVTTVIKMESDFDGYYFDKFDQDHSFQGVRPFYIWIFGSSSNVNRFLCKLDIQQEKGFKDIVRFSGIIEKECPYTITKYGEVGDFKNRFGENLWHVIDDVETGKHRGKSKFGCSIAVDLSKIACDDSYLLENRNYEIAGGAFKIDSVVELTPQLLERNLELRELNYRRQKITFNPTHLICISTSSLQDSDVNIALKKSTPNWILNSSSLKDIPKDNTTFGFIYLMSGISNAYDNQNKNKDLMNLEIELNQ